VLADEQRHVLVLQEFEVGLQRLLENIERPHLLVCANTVLLRMPHTRTRGTARTRRHTRAHRTKMGADNAPPRW
jgi:hypothetical protein